MNFDKKDTTLRVWFENGKSRSIPYVQSMNIENNQLHIKTYDDKFFIANFNNVNSVEVEQRGAVR